MYYGPAEDVALACELFTDISYTIASMGVLKWRGAFQGDGLSYCCGFAQALALEAYHRTAATSLAKRHGITTELAVRTRAISLAKRTKASAWLKEECGLKLGRARSRRTGQSRFNNDAYTEGRQDGRAHGLSATRKPKLGETTMKLTAGRNPPAG